MQKWRNDFIMQIETITVHDRNVQQNKVLYLELKAVECRKKAAFAIHSPSYWVPSTSIKAQRVNFIDTSKITAPHRIILRFNMFRRRHARIHENELFKIDHENGISSYYTTKVTKLVFFPLTFRLARYWLTRGLILLGPPLLRVRGLNLCFDWTWFDLRRRAFVWRRSQSVEKKVHSVKNSTQQSWKM